MGLAFKKENTPAGCSNGFRLMSSSKATNNGNGENWPISKEANGTYFGLSSNDEVIDNGQEFMWCFDCQDPSHLPKNITEAELNDWNEKLNMKEKKAYDDAVKKAALESFVPPAEFKACTDWRDRIAKNGPDKEATDSMYLLMTKQNAAFEYVLKPSQVDPYYLYPSLYCGKVWGSEHYSAPRFNVSFAPGSHPLSTELQDHTIKIDSRPEKWFTPPIEGEELRDTYLGMKNYEVAFFKYKDESQAKNWKFSRTTS